MFPYKVRKPAWGSLKPKSSQKENNVISHQLGGDPADCQTIGGYLQRAILFDLVELRQRYFDVEVATAASASVNNNVNIQHEHDNNHLERSRQTSAQYNHHDNAALGSSFARFKACFREARFGAIHTRTIPPRVDRGEYVQLLYSSCLHLLEQAFRQHKDSNASSNGDDGSDECSDNGITEPLCWENRNNDKDSQQTNNNAFNAIYAAFLLYTLHQTNVLPEAPPPRSHTTKRTNKSGKQQQFDEQSLKDAWSMLPIGINSDEDRQLYRRTYRTGVRIDRWNYLLLVRLRDACHARVDMCSVDNMRDLDPTVNTNTDSRASDTTICNTNTNELGQCHCHCGLAKDAAHIIDQMLCDDKFFEYCEYHGPQSLEGLAGSGNYYNTYFSKPPKKKKKSKKRTKTNSSITLGKPRGLLGRDLKTIMGSDDDDDLLDVQNLSTLADSHRSNLSSVMALMQKSRQTGGELQPKQRERVESALGGVEEQSTTYYLQLVVDGDAAKRDFNVNDPSGTGHDAIQVKSPPDIQCTDAKQDLLLNHFPGTFSSALRKEVRFLLPGIVEDAERMRRDAVKGKKTTTRMYDNLSVGFSEPIINGFEDFDTVASQQTNHVEFSIADELMSADSTADRQRGKKRRRKETRGAVNEEDEVSVATGAGKNALLSLLSMAKGNVNDDVHSDALDEEDAVSMATGAGKNALLSLLSMAEEKEMSEQEDESLLSDNDAFDLRSFHSTAAAASYDDDASGMGRQALQFLLTQSAPKVKAGPRKRAPQSKTSNKRMSGPATKKKRPEATSAKGKQQSNDQKCRGTLDDGVDVDDDRSLAFSMMSEGEGAGKNALASLLSKATKSSSKKPRAVTQKKRPSAPLTGLATEQHMNDAKERRESLDGGDVDDDKSLAFSMVSEGEGANALASLLANITNVEEV